MAQKFSNIRQFDNLFPVKKLADCRKIYNANLRETLKTGDLVFFSGSHWLSKLIQWRSKSIWSHVGIVIRIEEIDRIFLVESVIEHGVRLIPIFYCLKDYDGANEPYRGRIAVARHQELNPEQAGLLKNRAFELLSKQYDSKELIRIAWRTLVGRRKLFPDKKYTCAELVHECYKEAGIHLKYPYGDFISPGAFWELEAVEMKAIIL